MSLDTSVLFPALFLTGLAGSLHCVGMCGPLLLGFSRVLGPGLGRGWEVIAYHAGRLWTYGLLGLIAGQVGSVGQLAAWRSWQQSLSVLAGGVVLVSGAAALGWLPGLRFDTVLGRCWPRSCWPLSGWLAALQREPQAAARFLFGAILGLIPCGLVYATLLIVAVLGHPVMSALGMLSFGLGTLPALTAFLLGSHLFPIRLRAQGSRIVGVLLLGMGSFLLIRALWLGVTPGMHH